MRTIDRLLGAFGLVRASKLAAALRAEGGLAKRLDEHREVAEAVNDHTRLFENRDWHREHMAAQDRYLQGLLGLAEDRDMGHVALERTRPWPSSVYARDGGV